MTWLERIDIGIFHCINQTLSNPVFDGVLPFFSNNRYFVPAVIVLAVGLLWKGGARGRVFFVATAVILALGDGLVINMLKHAVGRPRPFLSLEDVRLLVGRGDSGSMPSSHAATWFAATLIAFVFYRRSWRFMLPIAATVGWSRIYVGVHYPSDVVAGAILGAGYAAAGLWLLALGWQWVGSRWFPLWWRAMPSLLNPVVRTDAPAGEPALREAHFLRLGYVLIALMLVGRLVYIGSGVIEVSKDEAYQWLWSKHLALSYLQQTADDCVPPVSGHDPLGGQRVWYPVLFAGDWGNSRRGVAAVHGA